MLIVKAGGGAGIHWEGLADDLAAQGDGEKIVLIHGANARRNALSERLNVPVKRVVSPSGVSSVFTDAEALDIFLMAYPGLASTKIVAGLRRRGLDAVGLSGVDGGLWRARAKKDILVQAGGKTKLLRGNLTGRVETADVRVLRLLLEGGYLPVLCAPALDESGEIVNVDNDTAAAVTAAALDAERLVFLFEAPGFLAHPDRFESRIPVLPRDRLDDFLPAAAGGMAKKLLAARRALESGVSEVYFGDGRTEHPLRDALAGRGTVIR